ncbi:MAG: GNAT family N-acetyltransferase [Vicinamibacterales bacterium]
MPGAAERAALDRVPDHPRWVDTRGMLLTGRARVAFLELAHLDTDGFVVELASRALLSAIDRPAPSLVAQRAQAMAGDVNLLVAPEDSGPVAAALPDWIARPVRLHALAQPQPWESETDEEVIIATRQLAPPLDGVPEALRHDIAAALEGHPLARFIHGVVPERRPEDAAPTAVPVAFVLVDGRPAAFCYPVLQTERYWDVSVDTLDGYRGRGLAGRAARAMIRHMWWQGKSPVWGALESNAASLGVARRLGFVEAGRLVVFAAR